MVMASDNQEGQSTFSRINDESKTFYQSVHFSACAYWTHIDGCAFTVHPLQPESYSFQNISPQLLVVNGFWSIIHEKYNPEMLSFILSIAHHFSGADHNVKAGRSPVAFFAGKANYCLFIQVIFFSCRRQFQGITWFAEEEYTGGHKEKN